MGKIIFCDLNKDLVDRVQSLFDGIKENKRDIEFSTHCGDIIEFQKNNGAYIATASNPSFSMGGGIDAVIAENFPDEIGQAKEFAFSKNLFFTITVDSGTKATKKIIERALIGCFCYANAQKDIIISGFGTGIGGLSFDDFVSVLSYLRSADLSNANLSNANLRNADLSNADLRNADLSNAYLSDADLSNANLRNADLSNAYLSDAYLSDADLSNANLSDANLRNAYLRDADLSSADLSNANLSNANLRDADLSNANLRNADLSNALYNELTAFFSLQCPEEGSFIGRKKAGKNIIKMIIPENAKRSSATSRKCRAEFVKVLAIYASDGSEVDSYIHTVYDHSTIYKVGEITYPNGWDEDRWNECSQGIHFFITRGEAEIWNI